MDELITPAPTQEAAAPHMRRVLTLWDLVFYGIVLVQPIATVPLFGVSQKLSDGHFVTTVMLAMLPMLITAVSYGRMAAIYPSAGSAYTYVGKGLNVYLGFMVGWAMLLDYLLVPMVNGIWVAVEIHARYLPQISLRSSDVSGGGVYDRSQLAWNKNFGLGGQDFAAGHVLNHGGVCAAGDSIPVS